MAGEQTYIPSDSAWQPTEAGELYYQQPFPSGWRCFVFGDENGIVFMPAKGQEPNAFHRFMQRLCFGFRWVRR